MGGQFSKCPPNSCTCMPAHQAVAWTCATEAMILRKILIREMAGAQAPKMSPHVIRWNRRGRVDSCLRRNDERGPRTIVCHSCPRLRHSRAGCNRNPGGAKGPSKPGGNGPPLSERPRRGGGSVPALQWPPCPTRHSPGLPVRRTQTGALPPTCPPNPLIPSGDRPEGGRHRVCGAQGFRFCSGLRQWGSGYGKRSRRAG